MWTDDPFLVLNIQTTSFVVVEPILTILNSPGNSQGMQNIESSIPPNVSLQRTPDSQMSPGFNQQCIIQQQLSPSQQRPPFSPQQGMFSYFVRFISLFQLFLLYTKRLSSYESIQSESSFASTSVATNATKLPGEPVPAGSQLSCTVVSYVETIWGAWNANGTTTTTAMESSLGCERNVGGSTGQSYVEWTTRGMLTVFPWC